jgi:pimeloyl-ACP methyl ester carboxylesterase
MGCAEETAMIERFPILLLSGMAANEQLFTRQRAEFSDLLVPPWIDPRPGESLPSYAARFARIVDPGCPCLVGGASFGGMVALEMAPHLQARACVLIASVRSPEELPWRWRAMRLLTVLGSERLEAVAGLVARFPASSLPVDTRGRLRRLSRPEATFVRWASCAVAQWRPSPATRGVRVFQIHGALDRTLPVRDTRPDVVIPRGGHLLPLTHATEVNRFLRQSLNWTRQADPV